MPMRQNGLAKLVEEAGEALQVAGKMIQYPELQLINDPHPDGTILRYELEQELGDLLAAVQFVTKKLSLDSIVIYQRSEQKFALFQKWDEERT